MSLEDFKAIADERTRHVVMSPELQHRIQKNIRGRTRPVGRATWIAAAACFVVMVVSGTALVSHLSAPHKENEMIITAQLTQAQTGVADEHGTAHKAVIENESQAARVSDGIVQDGSLKDVDLNSLPAPALIGDYSEGYAPAQNEDGLWGYVDLNEDWVLAPVYVSVTPVENLQSTAVRADGVSVTPLFPDIAR